MKTLNVLIQNSKGNTSAELQTVFIYGVDQLASIIEGLVLPQGTFTERELLEFKRWLYDIIVKLEDGDLTDTTYTIVNRKVRLYVK